MNDPITKAIEVLNDALERDPSAITELVNMRAGCNESLAGHPTIQVQKFGDSHRIGILGLINGVFGGGPSGDIGAKGSLDAGTGKFVRVKRFVDLRKEKLDMLA